PAAVATAPGGAGTGRMEASAAPHAPAVPKPGAAARERDRRFEVIGGDHDITREDIIAVRFPSGVSEVAHAAHTVSEVDDCAADLLEPLAPLSFGVGVGSAVAPIAERQDVAGHVSLPL